MPVSEEDFMRRIAGASAAINEATETRTTSQGRGRNRPLPPPNSNAEGGLYDAIAMETGMGIPANSTPISENTQITKESASRSHMPDFIKDSMLAEQIDMRSMDPNELERPGADAMLEERFNLKRGRIIEGDERTDYGTAPNSVTPQAGGSIDYTIIKAIVNECVKNQLEEKLTTLQAIHLKGGKISLIDNAGNVYSAKLEKAGTLKKK